MGYGEQRLQYGRKAKEIPKMTAVQQASRTTNALGSGRLEGSRADISQRN